MDLDQLVLDGARFALDQWARRLGAPARPEPGLIAQLDQHTARIKETIGDAAGEISPVRLAAYADGVADMAVARGWTVGEAAAADWRGASWPSVHLLAVCLLASGPGRV
jgi:hypothetical protein